MPDDETVAPVAPAEAPEQHQAEAETTSAAGTEVVPAASDPPATAAPVIVHDQWTQTARDVQESIARDLDVIKRLDELLSQPIFLTPRVPPPDLADAKLGG